MEWWQTSLIVAGTVAFGIFWVWAVREQIKDIYGPKKK